MDYQGNANKRKRSPSPSPAGNTSSASPSASGGEYEVFLSFCGVDTRHRFTDFLYTCLIDAGIHTFRDNEELHVGEEIGGVLLKAIEESKISIPIFSKNYASSKWCLRELAQMVKCYTDLEQKIFPIFYDVEPSDVRHQTGSYEQAFRNHERRFDGTIVQQWKEALTTVGKLKGLELEKETNGHEGELAKKVTMKVLIELKKNYMDVTEDLVGIEDQVKEMEELLNAKSDAVQIVGIRGMGGIGKTTLAKVIYNKISEHFESFSFLENVRERIQQHEGLVGLQNELCLNRKALDNIANVDERRNMIKNTVCRKKFFIVLDDVDEKSQFDKLVKPEWFDKKSRGSKIIVTTRNKEVLTLIAADSTYESPTMEFNHSLQLFSKHAFRKDFPPEEYHTLSRKFVDTAAGLPLALELTGSHLYAQNKSNWPGILEKLQKIPRQDVQKKLEISYEALDDLQKQIFLDIACFLIGEEKRVAFYMWKDCKFYPEDGIDVLVLRSLIKISDDNRLWMHDQLRDMGRNIVYKENRAKPWERSRVWSCDDAWETMERCQWVVCVSWLLRLLRFELEFEGFSQFDQGFFVVVQDMDDVHDGASVFESQGLDDSVGIVEPKIGMSFGSEEEVRMFYSKYAMSQGFGIAKISVKCDDNGSLKYYSLACSRNGKYVSLANNGLNPRPTIKIGCKAKINIVVRSEGEFVISKVCIPHNHSLSPQSSRYLPCHRRLDSMTKRVLEINDRAGIKPSKSYVSLVVAAGGYEQVKYGEKDVRNYLAKARDYRLGIGDAEAVCTYFKRMQIRNPNFFYVVDLDKDGRLRNLFWADARSRAAYESFSDVVSFDSTYLTNEYRMPFAPFVGVNHHGQSILFGCGLLSFEGVEGYTWLFRNWLECMSFNAPKAIITDQCKSIQAAVAEVFPDTRYRLCLWHIMRKIPIKFGAFKEYKKIKKCLKAVVYESITVNEFEQGWAQLLCDFELGENDWLKSLYDDRKRWVPVFVKEMFWAGMSTTQRNESMNAFFEGYLNSKTTLKQFVEQYDEALKKKIENENIADFSSFNSTIPLITDFEFEKQFQNAYTHDMFRKFQAEIRGMICCNVSLVGSEWHVSTYQVCDVAKGKDGKERKVLYNVLFNEVEFEVLCLSLV